MMSSIDPTPRSRVRRLPARGQYDRATVHAIVDAAPLCHVAIASADRPVIIPMLHARVGDSLYLHGSRSSRLINAVAQGAETCVAFTLLDGLVLARSALHHSMNYRSVVLFGRGRAVEERAEKLAALEALVEQVVPGRWDGCRQPSEQEFRATAVVAVPIDEASAKVRTGPPKDDEADLELPVWAGVVPLRTTAGTAEPAPDLASVIDLPEHVRAFVGASR